MGGGPLQRKAGDMEEGGESKEGHTEGQTEAQRETQTKKKEAGVAVIERARAKAAKAEAAKKGEQDKDTDKNKKTTTEEEEEVESPVSFADANKDVKTLALRRQCTELGVDRTGSRANLLERLGALDAAAKAAAKAATKAKSKEEEGDAKVENLEDKLERLFADQEEDVKTEEQEGGASGANELIEESERGSVCPECDELVSPGKTECDMCGTEVAVAAEMAGDATGDAIDATEGKDGAETEGSDGEGGGGGGGGRSVLVLRRGLGAAELTEAAATTADLTAIRASGGQHIAWKRGSTGKGGKAGKAGKVGKGGKTSFLQFYEEGKDLAETQTVRATVETVHSTHSQLLKYSHSV